MGDPITTAIITTGIGAAAQSHAASGQQRAQDAYVAELRRIEQEREAARLAELERQRQAFEQARAEFEQRVAPVRSMLEQILEPGFQAVDPALQERLFARVDARVQEAIQRAQERVRADAIRRRIYRSGVTGEALRDVEERGMEQLAQAEADIATRAADITRQTQQWASQSLHSLQNPFTVFQPDMNLVMPMTPQAGLLEAELMARRTEPWQEFASQFLAAPVSALTNQLFPAQQTFWDNLFSGWVNPQTQKTTQSAFQLSLRPPDLSNLRLR